MAPLTRSQLKNLWVSLYRPKKSDYDDVWDSFYNIQDDGNLITESSSNIFNSALDFTLANNIYYSQGDPSGALEFTIGTPATKDVVMLYTEFSGVNVTSLDVSAFNVIKNEFILGSILWGMMILYVNGEYQASVYKIKDIDLIAPTITGYNPSGLNNYVDVNFSEGVYGSNDGTTPVDITDLQITNFIAGGITAISISSIEKTTGGVLTGGETSIRCNLSLTGTPTGAESFEIQPIDGSSIYDASANVMLATETTGTISFAVNYIQWTQVTGGSLVGNKLTCTLVNECAAIGDTIIPKTVGSIVQHEFFNAADSDTVVLLLSASSTAQTWTDPPGYRDHAIYVFSGVYYTITAGGSATARAGTPSDGDILRLEMIDDGGGGIDVEYRVSNNGGSSFTTIHTAPLSIVGNVYVMTNILNTNNYIEDGIII
jgi:hypothetical protein